VDDDDFLRVDAELFDNSGLGVLTQRKEDIGVKGAGAVRLAAPLQHVPFKKFGEKLMLRVGHHDRAGQRHHQGFQNQKRAEKQIESASPQTLLDRRRALLVRDADHVRARCESADVFRLFLMHPDGQRVVLQPGKNIAHVVLHPADFAFIVLAQVYGDA